MANVLVIDDDQTICEMLCQQIDHLGHQATYAKTITHGKEKLWSGLYDVVILDVRLPDGNGLETLPDIQNAPAKPDVIIITGEGDPDGAELAIKNNAWDYIEKPITANNIILPLTRVLQYREEKNVTISHPPFDREGLIGCSSEFQACLDLASKISASDTTVLLTGETGTGKEIFARAIHKNSPRGKSPFVVVDCTSIPETLVESILFGYRKGAFTGAEEERMGLIKEADGGTLFLDEVGDLSLSIQKNFLRVLQDSRFRPLGGTKESSSDFRLIAATNRDLEKMVEKGQYRQDLLFRLQAVRVQLPPLRGRIQDIRDLISHYVMENGQHDRTETKGLSPEFLEMLVSYNWPGNVRELVNTIESILTISRYEPTLYPKHLPTHIRIPATRATVKVKKRDHPNTPTDDPTQSQELPKLQDARKVAISKVEHQYLQDLMLATKGEIREACRISGLSRAQVYSLMKKHGINRSD